MLAVLVYNNNAYGGFNDEKNTAIEVIQHGVRTIQGGTVRLSRTTTTGLSSGLRTKVP